MKPSAFVSFGVGSLILIVNTAACAQPSAPTSSATEAPKPLAKALRAAEAQARKDLDVSFSLRAVEGLYVVGSNTGGDRALAYAELVRNVHRGMYAEFFERPMSQPVKVYLFRDAATYMAFCKRVLGDDPGTPYGFYLSERRTMVMNIATGGGTLVHELVHPLLMNDFPSVSPWFNEGFASLFEATRFTKEGYLRGVTNWRLPQLQESIQEDAKDPKSSPSVSLRTVMTASEGSFYDSALGYPVARYLCQFLQERGLLRAYYRAYRDGAVKDPTGVKTLEKVTGKSLGVLEVEWKAWVMRQRL